MVGTQLHLDEAIHTGLRPQGRPSRSWSARRSHGLEIADTLIAAVATTAGLALRPPNCRDLPMPDLQFDAP